jgi:acylphosphatase
MEEKVRAHLIISGRVQGVCYRMETQSAANQIGVFGWVRNKRDGRVEALVEGTREQVESLIEWCRIGPPIAHVKDVEVTWESYRGEFRSFEVTY